MDLVLVDRQSIADDVVLLSLRREDGGALPPWEPGAHVDVVLGDLVRQYSLCSDPADRTTWRIAVRRAEDGRGGSSRAHALAVGDAVWVHGPRNTFPLVPAARYLFVAGGIGITPILPMVRRAAADGIPWRLVYVGRRRSAMAFRDELPDGVELHPRDEVGPPDLAALLSGTDDGTAVYCCGPERMLAAVSSRPRGPSPHVERFSALPVGEPGAFEVELASSGLVLPVPADRSVLDVLEAAGVAVLWSCREGTCGTCETGVLAGAPEHHDTVLTEDERRVGDVLMVCVSRSSGRLVLDL
ncbi:PDR/VanB family oxidoreductase [Umezawaea tangerina]|uniref:Ferredoxin-NADP reductase n=1 Tax=Umezawaea tangerina TaxID=84725 RepID=A0A2T0TFW9_9PSEU|nr:PDR/VanB family oxidoreductase [Umezawaea tangerina]PRY44582.1 ferredoxin-NADP reductase [Umezawaea tangerina]